MGIERALGRRRGNNEPEALIEQLDYLREEIRMLVPLVESLPEEILHMPRASGAPGVVGLYRQLLVATREAERRMNPSGPGGESSDPAPGSEADELKLTLSSLYAARADLTRALRSLSHEHWTSSGPARTVAIGLIELDLAVQRQVAEILSERPYAPSSRP